MNKIYNINKKNRVKSLCNLQVRELEEPLIALGLA